MPSQDSKPFFVELIKPSHYDDDGYVIQWLKAAIPSNSLACLNALVLETGASGALGADTDIVVNAYDECQRRVPVRKIIQRIRQAGGRGIVMFVGVQSNQFPRTADLAKRFRAGDIQCAVGGFHVSGCLAMLPSLPPDIQAVQDLGVTLFAGEAEGRMDAFLRDALHGDLKPVYDYMADLPDLGDAVTPILPRRVAQGYMSRFTSFDSGRGCPFQCSFCTIINVQGRKSRHRTADDVEKIVRANVAQGIKRFFITDDNFARNRNWEAILDRLIFLRREHGIKVKLLIQVDTLCHLIPNFIEKCRQAGCNRVYIGLENINPDNLGTVNKHQNRITEYRKMLQAWRAQRILVYAGYILGFPGDTPESIHRDVEILKRELPVDIIEFFILTPLPGSEDHQKLAAAGTWMDPDMNKYDLEHVTQDHPTMSREEVQAVYDRSWHQYYTWDHIETLLRRGESLGSKANRITTMVTQFYGSYCYEKVHPIQGGILRRKDRRDRRDGMPRENPVVFYPKRLWQMVSTYTRFGLFALRMQLLRRRVERDRNREQYQDVAIAPVVEATDENLEMFEVTPAAKKAAAKARGRVRSRASDDLTATAE